MEKTKIMVFYSSIIAAKEIVEKKPCINKSDLPRFNPARGLLHNKQRDALPLNNSQIIAISVAACK